ncbi:hypothetical protein HKX48_002293 [Thoreauomyces humboldtii]|nr:hypothetical protein HKX48_002293 [Thoreauomyces humboldtii]
MPAKGAQRHLVGVAIQDSWVQACDQCKGTYQAPAHRDVLHSLQDFLMPKQHQGSQLAALRKLASTIGKLHKTLKVSTPDSSSTLSLLEACIVSPFLQLHFAPSAARETSFRIAIFAVLAQLHNAFMALGETEQTRQLIATRLQSSYKEFIADPLVPVVHLGAVILTTFDAQPLGRSVVESTFGAILTVIAGRLDSATKESVELLLKIATPLMSRCPELMQTLASQSHHALQSLLDAVFRICGDADYGQDNQFLAGFVMATLVHHCGSPEDVLATLFGDHARSLRLSIASQPLAASPIVDGSPNTYATLCIYRGLLTTFSAESCMTNVGTSPQRSFLEIVATHTLAVADEATDVPTRILSFQVLIAWLSCISKLLRPSANTNVTPDRAEAVRSLLEPNVIGRLFAFVVGGWEDDVESMQLKLKDLLLLLLDVLYAAYSSVEVEERVKQILTTLLAADWHRKMKYDLMSLMLSRVQPRTILALCPEFLDISFDAMTISMLASRISAFVNKFLQSAFTSTRKEDADSSDVNAYWVDPVSRALMSDSQVLRKVCSENMINFILKENKACLPLLLEACDKRKQIDEAASTYHLHATVAILKAARLLGLVQLNDYLGRGSIVEKAIMHPDENLRVDVLALLCDTRAKTADFSAGELAALRSFLLGSLDSQSPEFRQRIQAHLNKLLRRLRNAMYADWRDLCSRKEFIDAATSEGGAATPKLLLMRSQVTDLTNSLALKRDFMQWLCDETVAALFPGCSFQRATSNLALMQAILVSQDPVTIAAEMDGAAARVSLADMPNYPTLATPATVQTLLALIGNDTHQPNRNAALHILVRYLPAELPGTSMQDIHGLLGAAIARLNDVRSHESETAATIVRIVFAKYVLRSGVFLNLSDAHAPRSENDDPAVFFIRQFVMLLKANIDVAKSNLYRSSTTSPMHGLFRTLRGLLSEIDFTSELVQSNLSVWRALVGEIMTLVDDACETVLAVCADESPEGNLPASFADMQNNMENVIASARDDDDDEEIEGSSVQGAKSSESQLMLYSCFHTIKETSAVLQALLCRTPLPDGKMSKSLVTHAQIVRSGDLLRRLLGSIRHRGAFSAVHVCFSSLCGVLLAAKDSQLAALPPSWLQGFLAQAAGADVSITRRSAGLPLGVCAVVSAGVHLLPEAARTLLAIATKPVPSDKETSFDLPQVHAYNILRAILQDAHLTTRARPFVGDALNLSMQGFSSLSFPVRNCAAMLFATCIAKAFGSKISRDDRSNAATGREFFSAFPQLRTGLLETLEEAVETLHTGNVHPALYPVLTVLARLKPSALDTETGGNDDGGDASTSDVGSRSSSRDPLAAFRPALLRCAAAPIAKARDLSARAFASMVGLTELVSGVKAMLEPLADSSVTGPQNTVHGNLLIVAAVFETQTAALVVHRDASRDAVANLPDLFLKAARLTKNPCPVTHALYIDVATRVFGQATWIPEDLRKDADRRFATLRNLLAKHAWDQLLRPRAFGDFVVRRACASFALESLAWSAAGGEGASVSTDLAICLLKDEDYEVQLAVLSFIETRKFNWDVQSLRVALTATAFLDPSACYYQVSQRAAAVLTTLSDQDPSIRNDVDTDSGLRIESILDASPMSHGLAAAYLPLLASVSSDTPTSGSDVLARIDRWTQDSVPLSTRLAAVKALRIAARVMSPTPALLFLYLRLLDDEDPDVREDVAAIVGSVVLSLTTPITASHCRDLLTAHIGGAPWKTKELSSVIAGFTTLLIGYRSKEPSSSTHSVEPEEAGTRAVLFAREADNLRTEALVDVRLAVAGLTTLISRHPRSQTGTTTTTTTTPSFSSDLDPLRRYLATTIPVLEGLDPASTSDPAVFATVLRAVGVARVLDLDVGPIVSWHASGKVHPALRAALEGGEIGGVAFSPLLVVA